MGTSSDKEIVDFARNSGEVIITHDLDTLWRVTNRVAFLYQGGILDVLPLNQLVTIPHKAIQTFFNGPRGRSAQFNYGGN